MANNDKIKKIFEQHFNSVYRVNLLRTNNKQQAEDITSESFLRLAKQGNIQPDTAKAWLIKVSHNIMVDNYRKNKKSINLGDMNEVNIVDEDTSSVEAELITEKDIELVKEFLQELDPITKEIIALKVWEEYTFVQISPLVNLPVNSVKTKYYRGLQEMKQAIEKSNQSQRRKYILAFPYILYAMAQMPTNATFIPAASFKAGLLTNLISLSAMQGVLIPGISAKMAAVIAGIVFTITVITIPAFILIVDPFKKDETSEPAVVVESQPVVEEEEVTVPTPEEPALKTKAFTMRSRGIYPDDDIFSAQLLDSEQIIVQDEDDDALLHNAVDEIVIKGEDFELEISYFWEIEASEAYLKYVSLGNVDQYGTLYRVTFKDPQPEAVRIAGWAYTNDISLTEDCEDFGFITQKPCGKYLLRDEEKEATIAVCRPSTEVGLARCDAIIKSLRQDRIPTE